VTLSRISGAFGYSPTYTSELILSLIESNQLKARIDTEKQTVVAYNPDQRVNLFKRALEAGEGREIGHKMALLRLRLVERDVVVRDPSMRKGKGGGGMGDGRGRGMWEEPN